MKILTGPFSLEIASRRWTRGRRGYYCLSDRAQGLPKDSAIPPIVTTSATILCVHGGRVTLVPRQATVVIAGGSVLCEPDLAGAPIIGCAVPPTPSTKPCTTVVSTLPGSTSLKVKVGGKPVYLATLSGITDGVPPGTITVVSPGQTTVQA